MLDLHRGSLAGIVLAAGFLLNADPASSAETTLHDVLTPGATFAVRAVDGSIDVRKSTGPATVIVRATTMDGAPVDMHVAESRGEGTWTVCAVPLAVTTCDDRASTNGNMHTRIDFRVALPGGVKLQALGVSGTIAIRHVASDVDAKSVSGDIHVTTSSTASARTVSGYVDVAIGRVADPVSFASVSGDVHLAIPHGANASVHAKSVSGDVSGGPGITFSGNSGFVGHDVNATIGHGGPAVDIKTVSGSIFVKTL